VAGGWRRATGTRETRAMVAETRPLLLLDTASL
jgi:hypothetical protein